VAQRETMHRLDAKIMLLFKKGGGTKKTRGRSPLKKRMRGGPVQKAKASTTITRLKHGQSRQVRTKNTRRNGKEGAGRFWSMRYRDGKLIFGLRPKGEGRCGGRLDSPNNVSG